MHKTLYNIPRGRASAPPCPACGRPCKPVTHDPSLSGDIVTLFWQPIMTDRVLRALSPWTGASVHHFLLVAFNSSLVVILQRYSALHRYFHDFKSFSAKTSESLSTSSARISPFAEKFVKAFSGKCTSVVVHFLAAPCVPLVVSAADVNCPRQPIIAISEVGYLSFSV